MSLLLGVMTQAFSQAPYKIHTSPKLPARDALQRMNLVMAWTARVSVDGDRDGIFSVQIIPGKTNQLVVQTFKGAVYLYDANTGDLAWKTTVGVPYWEPQPAGFNTQSIFVTRRNVLYVLNRANGTQRVFTYNESLKQAEFGYELSFTPSATLVADEDFLYVPMGDRLHAIYIPDFLAIEKARRSLALRKDDKDRPLEEKKNLMQENLVPTGPDSPQPVFFFGYRFADQIMTSPPLIYGDQISMLTTDGTLTSVDRFAKGPRKEIFEFQAHGKVLGGAGQYNEIAYIGSSDFNLYAVNMNGGKIGWRFVSGAPILRKPDVNDNAIFIAPEKVGLVRLDRSTGREIWTNRETVRFLAANSSNVYALDRLGRFYVLDARRGTALAKYDLSEWTIAMPNEWTDRVYLAANDGRILCLRHRDLAMPLVMKTEEAPKKEEPVEKKKKKKVDEKKDDDKKDDDKKKDDEKKDDKEKQAAARFEDAQAESTWGQAFQPVRVRLDRLENLPPRDERRTWASL